LVESVDAGVGGVDVGTGGDVTVTVLGDGGSPLTIDTGTILGTDAPSLTVTLPDLPVASGVPSVVNTVTETVTDIVNVPDAITTATSLVPDVINAFTAIPDIIDVGGRDGDDDGDVTVINNPPTVVVIGDTRYPPI